MRNWQCSKLPGLIKCAGGINLPNNLQVCLAVFSTFDVLTFTKKRSVSKALYLDICALYRIKDICNQTLFGFASLHKTYRLKNSFPQRNSAYYVSRFFFTTIHLNKILIMKWGPVEIRSFLIKYFMNEF